ncbi:MAG TPA: FecR domain-containing protein [Chryseolinea sp.]|nr:FecR domain-containing protein [Chryseolinea sp.]
MERKIHDFLAKFAKNEYTEKEHRQFLEWMKMLPAGDLREVIDMYPRIQDLHVSRSVKHSQLADKIEAALDQQAPRKSTTLVRLSPMVYRAAIVAAVFFASVSLIYISSRTQRPTVAQKKQTNSKLGPVNTIAIGGNKASLILSDGTAIVLDDAANGLLTTQAGIKISKTADGQLKYDASQSLTSNANVFNTIKTPRGGQYQVVLPDGSSVWLNAASSLKFPTVFSGNERKVELTGEAYFEVAKNAAKPFIVASGNQNVEVLGTHFNINAYQDDGSIRTTLLEGSIKVSHAQTNDFRLLAPGQQAELEKEIRVTKVDVHQSIAWKKGYFSFAGENIKTLMRQISRWYDVEVEYEGNLTTEGFVGSMSRFENVSEVLHMLELTGMIHFKFDGRKIIVSP